MHQLFINHKVLGTHVYILYQLPVLFGGMFLFFDEEKKEIVGYNVCDLNSIRLNNTCML